MRAAVLLLCLSSVIAAAILPAGCGSPYRGPKRLAGAGLALMAAGGATWVVGERTDRDALAAVGLTGTLVGIAAALAAGGWMALQTSCDADYQCPEGEACREIPAPPGATPYKQCMRR